MTDGRYIDPDDAACYILGMDGDIEVHVRVADDIGQDSMLAVQAVAEAAAEHMRQQGK